MARSQNIAVHFSSPTLKFVCVVPSSNIWVLFFNFRPLPCCGPSPLARQLIVCLCCCYADTMPQVLVTPLLTYTTANETKTSFCLRLQGKSLDCLLWAAQRCPESGEGASPLDANPTTSTETHTGHARGDSGISPA